MLGKDAKVNTETVVSLLKEKLDEEEIKQQSLA